MIKEIMIAWISRANPIDRGCLKKIKVIDIVSVIIYNDWIIQRIV